MATAKTYTVRLIDLGKARGGGAGLGSLATDIGQKMKTWYTSVCTKASSNAVAWSADVQWLEKPPTANASQDPGSALTINMIVFFVPIPRDSVILLHKDYSHDYQLGAINDPDARGETVTNGATKGGVRIPDIGISEVYVDRFKNADTEQRKLEIARMGFHESMHNQMMIDDAHLHQRTGFAKAIPEGTAPNATNVQQMANALDTLVPQWLGGFQAWLDWDKTK